MIGAVLSSGEDTLDTFSSANYYLIYYQIPDDDEGAGYAEITIVNNIMTIKSQFKIESIGSEFSYRSYSKL